ncbi:hypothetical protein MTO96_001292 [Rhipicephalus appendiculatus]
MLMVEADSNAPPLCSSNVSRSHLGTCPLRAKSFWLLSGPTDIAKFVYTDYKTCTVTEVPVMKAQTCVLWVTREGLADVAQECEDYYEDHCGMELVPFDEETCGAILANP